MRATAQSVGHMEVMSLLPTSSWTVLVPLLTLELSYHPPGADEEWRDEGGDTGLTAAPVHLPKSPPSNTSVLSLNS